jgi:hypothetical protein
MRNKLLRIFAILFALAAVTLMIGLYGMTNRSKTDGGNGGISLEPPLFISVAEAQPRREQQPALRTLRAKAGTGIEAFPAEEVGISAYVKLPKAIDIDKVRTIFTQVEDVGDNYIIGIVPIPNWEETTEVHLYADKDGWLVACFTREEPAAKIMKWPENYKFYDPITKITTTTLREALGNAGQAAGVGIPPGVKYYDFRFPDANALTLFVKASYQPAITQVKIPADWTLYEASYYYNGYNSGTFKVDGTQISYISTQATGISFGSYEGTITVGVLHAIEIHESGGDVATVLIYKTD